jgi:hypothetical protein
VDQNVTIRFYRIEQRNDATPVSAVLEHIEGLALLDRDVEVEDGIVVRLEQCQTQRHFTRGEVIRRQTSNLPPKALAGQPIESLGVESIGHSTAFLYDSRVSVLGFEQARNGITSSRFALYIAHFARRSGYDILPIPTQEMWNTLTSGRIRAMQVRVAAPQSLEAVDAATTGVKAGLIALQQAAGTHYVEAQLGMTRGDADINRRRGLEWFRWFRRERESGRGEITHVYVDIIPEGATQAEHINLLAGQLGGKQRLDLPEDDPEASYRMREAFIAEVMRRHRDELDNRYHP